MEDIWLWLLIGFIGVPILLALLFLAASESLSRGNQGSKSVEQYPDSQMQEDSEYIPLTFRQELLQQLKVALKFGITVQLGFGFILYVLSILSETQKNITNDSIIILVYGLAYVPPIIYGYILVKNKLNFRTIIVCTSTILLGVTLYALYVSSRNIEYSYFGEPLPTMVFLFQLLQFTGMIPIAPIVTFCVYIMMVSYKDSSHRRF